MLVFTKTVLPERKYIIKYFMHTLLLILLFITILNKYELKINKMLPVVWGKLFRDVNEPTFNDTNSTVNNKCNNAGISHQIFLLVH